MQQLSLEHERENRRLEQEIRLRELAVKELQVRQDLEIKTREAKKEETSTKFKPSEATSLWPPFDECDVDGYYRTFESLAKINEWPESHWLMILFPKFIGRAQRVFNTLDIFNDYKTVKDAITKAYEITPEAYRQKFRNLPKTFAQTFMEFASEKMRLFKKWLDTTKTTTYESLVNLMILEELKSKMPLNILRHVEEKGVTTWELAAGVADSYSLLVHGLGRAESNARTVGSSSESNLGNPGGRTRGHINISHNSSSLFCNYCKKTGHIISQCKHPGCKSSSNVSDVNARVRSNATVLL